MKFLRVLGALLILSQWSLAWDRLSGCKLLPNRSNDGDSFHVEHEGREYIFRLYFVDCPESSMQVPERVAAQAKDFGVSEEEVLDTGDEATVFTDKMHLTRKAAVCSRPRFCHTGSRHREIYDRQTA